MSIITPQNAGFNSDKNALSRPMQNTGAASSGNIDQYLNSTKNAGNSSTFASVMADAQKPAKALTMPSTTETSQTAAGTPIRAFDQRMQQADLDKKHMQTLEQLSQNIGKSDNLLDVARNDVTTRNLRTVMGGFNLRAPATPMADSIKASALAMQHRSSHIGMAGNTATSQSASKDTAPSMEKTQEIKLDSADIGKLSQKFESGSQGISAIGYDRVGGTSYGKYQIASRVGSMDNFLNFLDKNAPDLAETLRASGPANTGSKSGAMPEAWRQIAAEEPQRFEALQEKFIYDSHYKPAVQALRERSSLDGDAFSPAMQEVLFSTAVQHGPTGAARIFSSAAAQSGSMDDANFDEQLINNIYEIRSGQFGASTPAIQASVRNRMQEEKGLALAMLQSENKSQMA